MPIIRMIVAVATLISATVVAAAPDWPTRPLTMVVTFAAGGANDVVGRILAPHMSEILGRAGNHRERCWGRHDRRRARG